MTLITWRGAASAVLALALQQAAPFETPVVGGLGGTPFADRCQQNESMAGVSAVLGKTDVVSIAIICQPIQSNGSLGAPGPARTRHGGSGTGTAAVALCPRGQIVRGMAVYFGDAVRGLGVYCRVWEGSAFGAAGAASETIGVAGGPMSPVTCPPDGGQPAVGMGGAATTHVVALRLICDTPRR